MGWWITLAVLAAIVLLFLLPVTVTVEARQPGNIRAKIGYLFFSFQFPKEQKKKKKTGSQKQPSTQEEPEGNAFGKLLKDRPLSETATLLKNLLQQVGKAVRLILKNVKVTHLCFDMAVAGEDAADTAVQYGKTCAAVYSAFAVVCNAVKVTGIREFAIIPDFAEGAKTRFYLAAHIRVKLFILLAAGVGFLARFLIATTKQKMTMALGQTTQEKAVQSK
ncbi:DUF2953 domain-containing protein [[Clostridium] leptum]|uniref:DUF2953 domain-containing protein n=1 Tax=Solibaculum mannosilyticum TaxID=2780922 RepID=A0A7I8D253_9FIRM|nr:DUF2953 domain-containing protein [Solibaculum mannosilyticum]MCO7136474.1 DUF2953 domain-containing protein [[Clostridium] leptum]BCI60075.1 hypothetical protein C12CBH8_07140 [Solibaculum mannosilyticum]